MLDKTIQGNDFGNVFTEVNHNEIIKINNPQQLRLFHLNVKNNKFDYSMLQSFIRKNIGRYVFSRAKRDEFIKSGDIESIGLEAVSIMAKNGFPGDIGTGNALGEVLLYAFLEQILEAPKLMSKVEIATSSSGTKCDAIHLLPFTDTAPSYYQLVFGASSVEGDILDAINNAFDSIEQIQNGNDLMPLLDPSNLDKRFDEETSQQIKNIIIPSKSSPSCYDNAYGIFIGYNLGLNPAAYGNIEYRNLLTKKMDFDIKHHANHIYQEIIKRGLSMYSFYFYILPFDNTSLDCKNVMTHVMNGGV